MSPSSLSRQPYTSARVQIVASLLVYAASRIIAHSDHLLLQLILALNGGALARLVVEQHLYHHHVPSMRWLRSIVVWECRFVFIGAGALLPGTLVALARNQYVAGGGWTPLILALLGLLSGWFLYRDGSNAAFVATDSRICPACGQRNIRERETCKRCGTPLSAYNTVSVAESSSGLGPSSSHRDQ